MFWRSEELGLSSVYWLWLWVLPRCSLMGFDLNRHWLDPSPWAHPTLHGVKQLIIQMYNDPVSNWTSSAFAGLTAWSGKGAMWYWDSPPGAANEEFRVKVREELGLLVSSLNWTSAFLTPHKHQLPLWRSHGGRKYTHLHLSGLLGYKQKKYNLC